MYEKTLPFPRGSTASDAGVTSLDDTTYSHLEGKIFQVPDTVHSSGAPVLLRAVKNDTGSAITVARTFMAFSTTSADDFGARVSGLAGAGAVCKPMDDKYAVGFSIPANDIFYVVESGPCDVTTAAGLVGLTAGMSVSSAANGLLKGTNTAHATEYSAGTAMEACATASTACQIWVTAGIKQIGT